MSVKFNGVEYNSKTAYAVEMVKQGKTQSEAARMAGINPATVHANTTGLEKVQARRKIYKALSLGKGEKYSVGEIAKRSGVNSSKVVALFKKKNIKIISKKGSSSSNPTTKAVNTAEVAASVAA